MGEVVNLRRARKLKRRGEADTAAAANRLRFGRGRAERAGEAMEAERATRLLDGAKLDGAKLDGAKLDGGGPEGVAQADHGDGGRENGG